MGQHRMWCCGGSVYFCLNDLKGSIEVLIFFKNQTRIMAHRTDMNDKASPHGVLKKKCLYCGNNPISHVHARIDSSVSGILDPLARRFLRTGIGRILFNVTSFMSEGILRIFCIAGVAHFDEDYERITSDRGKVLLDEARTQGWKCEVLCVFGSVTDTYRLISPRGQTTTFAGLPRFGAHTDFTSGWIDDKAVLKQRLKEAHVPVSEGRSFSRWTEAADYFHTAKAPCIPTNYSVPSGRSVVV